MGRQLRALTMSLFVGQRLTGMLCKERASDLERLAELVEAGKVTPPIDRTYPLAEVPAAMQRLTTGQARGKIAITI
jgi:NADPH:quinone reductase-like Zn-dependent oxidoreductase